MTPKLRALLLTLCCTVSSDQLSKAWVASRIAADSRADWVSVVDGFFYISHARNAGAAFGLLSDWSSQWRLVIFLLVSSIAVVVMVSFYRGLAPGDRFNSFSLGLIMGGALGNLSDRVLHGEVVDFLHFRLWGEYSWPDFNLADTYIVVGVAALMLELLASEGASRAAPDPGRGRDDSGRR